MGEGDDHRPANGNEGRKETTLIFRVFVANEILFFISIISLFHFLNFSSYVNQISYVSGQS